MKNLKLKHFFALMLAVSLLMTTVACGSKEETKQSESSKQEEKQSESSKQEEKTSEVSSEVKEPKEIVTVKYLFRKDPEDGMQEVEDAVNEILRERYGLELDMDFVATGEYNQRVQLAQSSGEEFDLCFTSNWANKFNTNVNRDGFLALDDYMDTEGGLMLQSAVPENLWGSAKKDGKIYAVPNNQVMSTNPGVVIQKEYADKYNLDLDSIKGIKDLYPFFQQILENEEDVYPFKAEGGGSYARDVVTDIYDTFGFGAVYRSDDTFTAINNYDAQFAILDLYHEMWELGYIRKDTATAKDQESEALQNMYVAQFTNCKIGVEADLLAARGKEYVCVRLNDPYMPINAAQATMTAVSYTSPNPEAAVKMIGVLYTDDEVFNMLCYGIEGKHYKWENDRVVRIENSGYTGFTGWELGNQFNAWLVPGQEDDVWEKTSENDLKATAARLDGFKFSNKPVETEVAAVSAANGEFTTIYANDNYEEIKKQLNEKLYDAGLQKVLDELQRQIDEFVAVNGIK